ncbi:MAG: hypothetical protein ACI9H8_000263 [Lysobacterales bacterium]|jgi:hypothetical protein
MLQNRSNLSRIKSITPEVFPDWSDQYRGPAGGVWIQPRKRRRIKAYLIDEKKEKSLRVKWLLRWACAIPLVIYGFWWLSFLFADLFMFAD